jgi:hypothetical protein
MDFSKLNLFKTVKSLHDKGAVTLTASERDLIDRETKELLSAANSRLASKAPKGFDKLLEDLKSSEDPDAAYEAVIAFMESNGEVEEKKPVEKDEKPGKDIQNEIKEKSEEGEEKKEKGKEKEEGGKEMGKGKGNEKDDEDDEDEKSEKKMKMPEKKDLGKGEMFGKGVEKEKGPAVDKKEDLEMEKKEIMARAKRLAKESDEDLQDLKDEDGDEEDMMSSAAMGVKDAQKVTVKITADRNIIVSRDGRPLFFHTTAADVKNDVGQLKRLANKLLGITIFEGAKAAAEKVGARLVAGADEDIELAADVDVPAVKDPVVADGETVFSEELDKPAATVQEDAIDDHKKARKIRRRKAQGVDEGIDIAVKDSMDNGVNSVTQTDEDVIDESKATPASDTQADAEVNYQSIEANFKRLYSARAKKEAETLNKAFIDQFIRAFKISAQRMLLNHDEHQFKIAAYDVLTAETDIDEGDAVSVAEGIAAKGHTAFVNQILARTSELMKKSDEYLRDIESDLRNQNVRIAEITTPMVKKDSRELRKSASNGNFGVSFRTPATRSNNNVNELRGVIGSTPLSKLATKLNILKSKG